MKNIFLALVILFGVIEAKEYKAVFDCSSSDSRFIKSRMWLVDKTMTMIQDKGDKPEFAMSLNANAIEKEDVLEYINISSNSFLDTIAYQNNGYALMTFK